MQSEMQQMSTTDRKPGVSHLAQYRNDISAKQREIRQRLGYDTTNSQPPKPSRDNIPSIDDDDEVSQMVEERRSFKSRYQSKYHPPEVDSEAEASLQFFKRNLLPSNEIKANLAANGQQSNRPTISSSSRTNLTNTETTSTYQPTASNRLTKPTTSYTTSFDRRSYEPSTSSKTTGIKPVPFKQTSLETAPGIERQSVLETRTTSYHMRSGSSPVSGTSLVEKPPNDLVDSLKAGSTERQRKSKSTERINASAVNQRQLSVTPPPPRLPPPTPIATTDLQEPSYRVEPKSINRTTNFDVTGRQSVDSYTPTGSFSRKPLYNSLLRAHDSIRLKVNRPKVRPKSDVIVPDTELEDIPLETINHQSHENPHERPVDVKRGSSRRKSKKKSGCEEKEDSAEDKLPLRNFSEVRVVKVVRSENERSLGVTVRAEDGNIVVARIMAGSLADKQGALQVGDVILSVNNREVYTPEQLQEQLRETISDDTVILKIVPSFREELPTLCIYLRALFTYDANEDSLLPCKEVGVSFNQGDILEVVNQEDPNWWQARRVDSENLQTGLIPSQELEERRRAFVIPDYDLATRTSICGTRVTRKSKKKEIYNVGQNNDFDKAELQLYEEVCRTPAFERRTLVLIGANGVGKQAFKARLITMDPERFGTPLPHTSRLPRDGEEDGAHYHFVIREKMEEDIIDGKYLEYGEYDGALYGTKLDSVREIIGAGKVCVLDCSATCLKILKTSDYLPFVAFIAAPTLDQLRYMHEYARNGNRNYTTLDRALSRQSRRAKTLQDFAFDFFEDEDLQLTVEESARLFRVYENYFDIVLVNNNFERTFEQLKDAIDALSMAPQWIPISWIYGT